VLKAAGDENDLEAVAELVAACTIEFDGDRLLLNQDDVTAEIRSPEVTAVSSIIASNPGVRSRLVELQRADRPPREAW
jgi:cytidylate kinase